MHKTLAIFFLLFVGCAHEWGPAAPQVALSDGTRWEQYCTRYGARDLDEVNRFLHTQGSGGWELISADLPTLYCFKKRIASAPQ
jgi:hypothetical protein